MTDGTERAVKVLQRNHGEIFKYLTVEVKKAKDWTKDDVKLNKGIFLTDSGREVPPEMKDLESKLGNKRIFNVSSFHLG